MFFTFLRILLVLAAIYGIITTQVKQIFSFKLTQRKSNLIPLGNHAFVQRCGRSCLGDFVQKAIPFNRLNTLARISNGKIHKIYRKNGRYIGEFALEALRTHNSTWGERNLLCLWKRNIKGYISTRNSAFIRWIPLYAKENSHSEGETSVKRRGMNNINGSTRDRRIIERRNLFDDKRENDDVLFERENKSKEDTKRNFYMRHNKSSVNVVSSSNGNSHRYGEENIPKNNHVKGSVEGINIEQKMHQQRYPFRVMRSSVVTTTATATATTRSNAIATTRSNAIATTRSNAIATTRSNAIATTRSNAIATTRSNAIATTRSNAIATTAAGRADAKNLGKTLEGEVYHVSKDSVFVRIGSIDGYGILFKNKANLGDDIEDMSSYFKVGQKVHVKVLSVNIKRNLYYVGNIIKYNEDIRMDRGDCSKGLITKVCGSYCFVKILKNGSTGYLHKSKLQFGRTQNDRNDTTNLIPTRKDNLALDDERLKRWIQFNNLFNIWDIIDVEIVDQSDNDFKSNYILTIPIGSNTYKKMETFLQSVMNTEREDVKDVIQGVEERHNIYEFPSQWEETRLDNNKGKRKLITNRETFEKEDKKMYIGKGHSKRGKESSPKVKNVSKVYHHGGNISLSEFAKTVKISASSVKKFFVINENKAYSSNYVLSYDQIKRACEYFGIDCSAERVDPFPTGNKGQAHISAGDNAKLLTSEKEEPAQFGKGDNAKLLASEKEEPAQFGKAESAEQLASEKEEPAQFCEGDNAEQLASEKEEQAQFCKAESAEHLASEKEEQAQFCKAESAEHLASEKEEQAQFCKAESAEHLASEKEEQAQFCKAESAEHLASEKEEQAQFCKAESAEHLASEKEEQAQFCKAESAEHLASEKEEQAQFCKAESAEHLASEKEEQAQFCKAESAEHLASEKEEQAQFCKAESAEQFVTRKEGKTPMHVEAATEPEKRNVVVSFIGHINHGKTSLFDCICGTKERNKEHGLITQNIRAFKARVKDGYTFTFIDTPGHEAFMTVRKRGVTISDISILVISGEEGIQEQTVECIHLIKKYNIKVIIAITKIDLITVSIDRILNDLLYHGISTEMNGGNIQVIECSINYENSIDKLLDAIYLESEFINLDVKSNERTHGVILDSYMEKNRIVSINLVQNGKLMINDFFYTGSSYGKIKMIINHENKNVKCAYPSDPVKIIGYSKNSLPVAGDQFFVVDSEEVAKEISDHNRDEMRAAELKNYEYTSVAMDTYKDFILPRGSQRGDSNERNGDSDKNRESSFPNGDSDKNGESCFPNGDSDKNGESCFPNGDSDKNGESRFPNGDSNWSDENNRPSDVGCSDRPSERGDSAHASKLQDVYVNFFVKSDKQGTIDVLRSSILKLRKEDTIFRVQNKIVYANIGDITSSDIAYARSLDAIIIGFNVKLSKNIPKNARKSNCCFLFANVLYELETQVISEMEKRLSTKPKGILKGSARILKIFNIAKLGKVAGCMVTHGTINNNSDVRILRGHKVVYIGKIISLKIVKEEKSQVTQGDECGMGFDNFVDLLPEDVVESYE
ncbi:sporozoite surface antigen MB2, putative [Plasmodium ovale]|uniref:Translation initiation factor IF-2, chloroplastic n=1 Tax=Plasmodium ovale TaxID=36330 RepID=A0A1C3KHX8_PLAOA|nr:sporozoite surface antigen MB2, putative [Plasmodium ovale]